MIRFPPRRILVGFDLSVLSMAAWRHAAALARRCGAALELVYVEASLPAQSAPYLMPGFAPGQALRLRKEIRAKVGDGPKITVTEGDPASRLLHLARAHRVDMIVVGTHGRTGLSRVLLGSVAEEVIRSSPVPVLVARGPVRDIRAILAPVHFTSYSDHGFAYAAGIAAGLGARLTALHVNIDPIWGGNALMRLHRLTETLPAALRARCEDRVVVDEDPSRGIKKASAKHDLVVLVAHKRSALEDVLIGTTAERVLRISQKPLLIVPPPHRVARQELSLPEAASSGRASKPAPIRRA